MPPKFGTSGLRGLVTELTDPLVARHVRAFVYRCPTGRGLFVGRDLRGSSPRIAACVAEAARAAGIAVTDCGAVPTPALALAAMGEGAAAVMVTGSHIPDDRNGLKFYTPAGEITKTHELAILEAVAEEVTRTSTLTPESEEGTPPDQAGNDATSKPGPAIATRDAAPDYLARYTTAFGSDALAGLRIGVYAHSAVGRDLLDAILRATGAETVELGRAERFVPVDTEAVDAATRESLARWAADGTLDAIVSTDGDGDRPLLADGAGQVIPGDILGQITAATLGADTVVTPVSSNTGVEASGRFGRVIRTRIGSPHVIAGMEAAGGRAVGYEANGGFLLGFDAAGPAGPLPALMTRDSTLPLLAPLALAARQRGGLAALLADQPARFTVADRLQDVPTEASAALVARLSEDAQAREAFLARLAARLEGVTMGDPLDEATNFGPLVSERQMQTVLGFIDKGKAEGARLVAGGARADRAGFFVEPTVFADVTDDMLIAREEIFGPVLSVLSFSDEAEVMARANATPYGLAAGVFTSDLRRAHRVAKGFEAGTCFINPYNLAPVEAPFGGSKLSGVGRVYRRSVPLPLRAQMSSTRAPDGRSLRRSPSTKRRK
ncbi:hypothetical protein LCGC14_1521010 [marine sediment metagenome]|uniref:Phosphomannomutase n=1 Tax=marine sediment metagenome TaxID=412755 RepID=A0A0F9IYL9_9ZZZZ